MFKFLIYDNEKLSLRSVTMKEDKEFLKYAYKKLNCDLIEFTSLTPTIDIVADEEGLLKSPIDMNYIYDNETERIIYLTGKLLIVGFKNGDVTGLKDEQIEYIKSNVKIDTLPISIFKSLI